MLRDIQVALRVCHENEEPISESKLFELLPATVKEFCAIDGLNQDRAVLVIVCDLSAEHDTMTCSFDEMIESLHRSLHRFSAILEAVSLDNLETFLSTGMEIDIIASVTVDCDEMELSFPAPFLEQIGRLRCPW